MLLSNRFWRYLTSIIFSAVILVATSAIEILSTNFDWEWGVSDGSVFLPAFLAIAICLVGQLFGDILDVEDWFNNVFVTLVKRVLFFAVVIGAIFIGSGLSFGAANLEIMMAANESPVEIGISMSSAFAPAYAFLLYTFGYIKYSKEYHARNRKRWLPFFIPISHVAGLLSSVLLAFIVDWATLDLGTATLLFGFAPVVIAAIGLVACFVTHVWPFEEDSPVYTSSSHTRSTSYSSSTGYDDYTPSTSSAPAVIHDCKTCAYHSNINPETDNRIDYCYYYKKPLGYFDNMDQDCAHYVRG